MDDLRAIIGALCAVAAVIAGIICLAAIIDAANTNSHQQLQDHKMTVCVKAGGDWINNNCYGN